MKTYTIGRDANCHIQFGDLQISRRHALIKVYPTGRMELVDMSSNGTYVNGTRVAPNKPIPVTRKDSVVFAYVGQLDWDAIPNPLKWIYYVGTAIVALIVIALLWIYVPKVVDYATGTDPEIGMGMYGGGGGGSSASPTPSDQGQSQGTPGSDEQNVEKNKRSWDKKILDEEKKKKRKENKNGNESQNQDGKTEKETEPNKGENTENNIIF